jgi:hypothetical protein
MSSNKYFYKGFDITKITDTTNSNQYAPSYNDFRISPTNYDNNKPLEFQFYDDVYSNVGSSTNISYHTTAYSTVYKTEDSLTNIDRVNDGRGANSLNVISISGGGGGGGYGGNAKAVIYNGNSSATGYGGDGGIGGYGSWGYAIGVDLKNLSSNTISVYVGGGGAAGANGKNNSIKAPFLGKAGTKGSVGKNGDPPKSSYILIDGTQYGYANVSNQGGGVGGEGASASASDKSSSNQGAPGNPGFPTTSQAIPLGFDPNQFVDRGVPGNGGSNGNQTSANSGKGGCVQIIWLYD